MNKLNLILTDELIFPAKNYPKPKKYQDRKTVKAIVENDKGEIAFVTNPIHKFYLLPGGGAESNDLVKEIKRECDEEINWEVDDVQEVTSIEEYRNKNAKHYTTYCFSSKPIKELPKDTRTNDEKHNKLEVRWINKKEALIKLLSQAESLKKEKVEFYNTGFNILRDYMFLQKYLEKK